MIAEGLESGRMAMERAQIFKDQIRRWLSQEVFPIWSREGFDAENGLFVENLGWDGRARSDARRAMVQCRQIDAFLHGAELGLLHDQDASTLVAAVADRLIRFYSHPSGSFLHSIDPQGKMVRGTPELYTQAFALFGLARAFSLEPRAAWKARAQELLCYLERERRASAGGFTEVDEEGGIYYQSNPHMHLYEAALAWLEVDPDESVWRVLAESLLRLCLDRFIVPGTGLIAERFNESWVPERAGARFYFEPGHQYEWTWLMGRHQKLGGPDLSGVRRTLFRLSETHGIDPIRHVAWDQLWSDFSPKSRDARFWPQCERIKAACQLGEDGVIDRQVADQTADQGMASLFRYLETPMKGGWYDTWRESGAFDATTVKASSLYHIIGAMSEYLKRR